jgi:hypothetical protein
MNLESFPIGINPPSLLRHKGKKVLMLWHLPAEEPTKPGCCPLTFVPLLFLWIVAWRVYVVDVEKWPIQDWLFQNASFDMV